MNTSFLRYLAHVTVAFLWVSLLINQQVAVAAPPSLETLAKQGDAVAQYELGAKYADMEGTENHETAAMLFRKSAEQGYAEGQRGLGSLYFKGKGVEQYIPPDRT